jgi:hypothetical protein
MIRVLLNFRSLDSTKDINNRMSKLFMPGIFFGGSLVVVPAQLKIDVTPWKLISLEGMVAEETSDTIRLDIPAGQTTIVAIRAKYIDNNNSDIELIAVEESTFNSLSDIANHVVLGKITLPISATQVSTSNIDLTVRSDVDVLGRSAFRGVVNSIGLLPATNNRAGDYYSVVDGIGGPFFIYGWDGAQWVNLTNVVQLQADLSAHRANLFVDEKHLSDDQYDAAGAAGGLGSSGNPVNAANQWVDELDGRLPTQGENDALVGSDGVPSSTNKYITQEFPLAVPEEKSYGPPSSNYLALGASDGPVYVGKSGVGSANKYFKLYNSASTVQREYQNATNTSVSVTGVFLDLALTVALDPGTDVNVDALGFFTGNLYVALGSVPDSALILSYGKRRTFKTYPADAMLRRTMEDAQTSAELIQIIQNISGRPYTTTPPVNEQNIELRKDIKDLREYASTILYSDRVVSNFKAAANVPDFGGDFVENVGIPPNYSFQNSSLVVYSYNSSTGVVTYASPVVLVSVIIGHVFIDGIGNEFVVGGIGVNSVTIQTRHGSVPKTINLTLTDSSSGSIKPDNNPRKINLADFGFASFKERILVSEIEQAPNEFHPNTQDVALQIKNPIKSVIHLEPRVRFFGGFKNYGTDRSSRIVATGVGRIMVTGFFTDLYLLTDLQSSASAPIVTTYVDNSQSSVGSVNLGSTTYANFTATALKRRPIAVATNLADGIPHTVELVISNNTQDFQLYGFELVRRAVATVQTIPGRAFVQTDLVKNDSVVSSIPPVVPSQQRGLAYTRYINRSLSLTSSSASMTDVDGPPNSPAGTAVSATNSLAISSGVSNLAYYKAGDIVRLQGASSEQVLVISSILGATVNFTTNINFSGAVVMLLIASTNTTDDLDSFREYARFNPEDFGTNEANDFSFNFGSSPATRTFTMEDGVTSLAGTLLSYVYTSIDGVDSALLLNGASATLRIRGVASKIDILVANDSATPYTVNYSVDGSPTITKSGSTGGLKRVTLVTNGRYQSHDILITNSADLKVAAIILHEPSPTAIEGTSLADQNVIANYVLSKTSDGSIIPVGAIAYDAFTTFAKYVNGAGTGSDWSDTIDATNAPLGRYVVTDREGSYLEFEFFGEGFECEYMAGPDRGKNIVYINGLVANSANYVANFVGIDASNGNIDMYNAGVARKRFGVVSLPFDKYTVRVQIQTPRVKNISSVGFTMNVNTLFLVNTNGSLSITPSKDIDGNTLLTDSARDTRNFDPGNTIIRTKTQFRTIEMPRDDYFTVGFNSTDDYICDGTADENEIIAAITAASASLYAKKVVIKPGTYNIENTINLPGNLEIEGWGEPVLASSLGNIICFQCTGADSTIKNLKFSTSSPFTTAAVDVNNQTGIQLHGCRSMTFKNANADTLTSPVVNLYKATVGSASMVTAGIATHSDLQLAINAVANYSRILLLDGTFVGPITVNKPGIIIDGQGYSSLVNGDFTFSAAADSSKVHDIRVNGNILFAAGANACRFIGEQTTVNTVTDSGTDSVYIVQDV